MLNPCPYCSPFDHEVEFVEIETLNFKRGIAVECLACGCRSMAADADDGEEMAAALWNSMSVADNSSTRKGRVYRYPSDDASHVAFRVVRSPVPNNGGNFETKN